MLIARLNNAPEFFSSLQGEGTSAGSPATFLRLSGCNLHCSWCDSKHAWGNPLEMSPASVAERLLSMPGERIIITGGEPLLQADDLEDLLPLLPQNLTIEVETNGTLLPSPRLVQRVNQWNVSPKLPHSGNATACIQPSVLAAFADMPNAWFKFVITREQDWPFIADLNLPHEKILLMPCASDRQTYRRLLPLVAEICLNHHVRLSPRWHIELWDNRQGV